MGKLQLSIKDEVFEQMSTLALVYAMTEWDQFVKEMGLGNGPDGEVGITNMRCELSDYTARMLYQNGDILALLLTIWGEEKTTAFVDKLMNHEHYDDQDIPSSD